MDEMSLESLHVSYGVPNSSSLENAKDNKWPSGHLPEAVTAHLDFFTRGVRFPFHFFLDTCSCPTQPICLKRYDGHVHSLEIKRPF